MGALSGPIFFSLQVVFSVIRIWMRAERTGENRGDWHLNIRMDRDVWGLTVRDEIWCHLKGGPLTWLNLEAKCSWRHMSPAHNMFPKWRRQPFCFKAQSIRVSNYWPSGFIHTNGAVWIFFFFFVARRPASRHDRHSDDNCNWFTISPLSQGTG